MIRYLYNRQMSPPAPFVYATVRNPRTGAARDREPAQLDTGADRSVIPGELAAALGLAELGEAAVRGLGAADGRVPTVEVEIALAALPPLRVEIFVVQNEPWLLLGRDVLNHYRVIFDGPNLALEIFTASE